MIYFASKFTHGRVNLESKTKIWCNEDDRELFEIIRRCIQEDKIWKLIEVISHGKGFEAYNALKLHFEGDKTRQYRSAMQKAVSCKMGENEAAKDYMIRVLKVQQDAVEHNIYQLLPDGSCPVVITTSLDNLPRRYQGWGIARRHMYDNGGYPPTRQYLEALISHEENEQRRASMALPIHAFNNDTYNGKDSSFNPRHRNHSYQGRNKRNAGKPFNSQGRGRGHSVPARGSGHFIPRPPPYVNHQGRGGGHSVPRPHPYSQQQGTPNSRRQQYYHPKSNKRQHSVRQPPLKGNGNIHQSDEDSDEDSEGEGPTISSLIATEH